MDNGGESFVYLGVTLVQFSERFCGQWAVALTAVFNCAGVTREDYPSRGIIFSRESSGSLRFLCFFCVVSHLFVSRVLFHLVLLVSRVFILVALCYHIAFGKILRAFCQLSAHQKLTPTCC